MDTDTRVKVSCKALWDRVVTLLSLESVKQLQLDIRTQLLSLRAGVRVGPEKTLKLEKEQLVWEDRGRCTKSWPVRVSGSLLRQPTLQTEAPPRTALELTELFGFT